MNRRGFFQTFLAGLVAWISSKLLRRFERQNYEGQEFGTNSNLAWQLRMGFGRNLTESQIRTALHENYLNVSNKLAADCWRDELRKKIVPISSFLD